MNSSMPVIPNGRQENNLITPGSESFVPSSVESGARSPISSANSASEIVPASHSTIDLSTITTEGPAKPLVHERAVLVIQSIVEGGVGVIKGVATDLTNTWKAFFEMMSGNDESKASSVA